MLVRLKHPIPTFNKVQFHWLPQGGTSTSNSNIIKNDSENFIFEEAQLKHVWKQKVYIICTKPLNIKLLHTCDQDLQVFVIISFYKTGLGWRVFFFCCCWSAIAPHSSTLSWDLITQNNCESVLGHFDILRNQFIWFLALRLKTVKYVLSIQVL